MKKNMFLATLAAVALGLFTIDGYAQTDSKSDPLKLPGGTDLELGHLSIENLDNIEGLECEKGTIVVPENRQSENSRNIVLYFYRIKAKNPSGKAPIFQMPGGPGGYYDESTLESLSQNKDRGRGALAQLYTMDRDFVLINQRGARKPDQRFQAFRFMFSGTRVDQPFDETKVVESMEKMSKKSIDYWTGKGMDLAGYDIANMVEDLNDIRKSLGYDKVVLRGSSFGSQWSFAYLKQYEQHVDRAILSGVEPLDHGYDSPIGIWNVFVRLEERLEEHDKKRGSLNLPAIKLTDAFKAIVKRLEKEPVTGLGFRGAKANEKEVPLGVDDFRRYLRRGINGRRESAQSLANWHRYIFETYNEDYSYLASQTLKERIGMSGGSLQLILIDNSLGISAKRDGELDSQEARKWVGEPNLIYKGTRNVTPTPVLADDNREVVTDVPVLLVHGDLDLSTPLENAQDAMKQLKNAHLLTVVNGTHGAFDQLLYDESEKFPAMIREFLDADFENDGSTWESIGIPDQMSLPVIQFRKLGGKTLMEEMLER